MKFIKNIFVFIGQVILLAFIGFLVWGCWYLYTTHGDGAANQQTRKKYPNTSSPVPG